MHFYNIKQDVTSILDIYLCLSLILISNHVPWMNWIWSFSIWCWVHSISEIPVFLRADCIFQWVIIVQTKKRCHRKSCPEQLWRVTQRSRADAKHISLQTFSIVSFHFRCSTGRLYLAFILKLINLDCLLCILKGKCLISTF